ncbi:hypothetical protein [Rhodopila sp.]|uniref:hypothetical protein n=1 Tax=Rhodopila sp. TaxID=2480087 RepID=UPI003D0A855A
MQDDHDDRIERRGQGTQKILNITQTLIPRSADCDEIRQRRDHLAVMALLVDTVYQNGVIRQGNRVK